MMAGNAGHDSAVVPPSSIILGYGPTAPLASAAALAWTTAAPWPSLVTTLAILWGATVVIFVAGVRRGYGFGSAAASTAVEIGTMLGYVVLAGAALVANAFGRPTAALVALVAACMAVAVLDVRAARTSDAPRHFTRLRGPQMAIALLALAALLVRQ